MRKRDRALRAADAAGIERQQPALEVFGRRRRHGGDRRPFDRFDDGRDNGRRLIRLGARQALAREWIMSSIVTKTGLTRPAYVAGAHITIPSPIQPLATCARYAALLAVMR